MKVLLDAFHRAVASVGRSAHTRSGSGHGAEPARAPSGPLANLRALLRYNSGIVWGHTPWLIVVPVAAGMLVLFWNMAMASMFTPSQAAQTTESLAPILAALLCAHLLGVEYRHHIGEITFSKPHAAGRILYLRLIAVYLLVIALVAVMLWVYVAGIGKPFPVGPVILAGIPSVLFLSMLSLMVATLFRQPAVGLAIAGLYWAADLYGGVELHPLLSLQGYGAALRQDEMAALWLPGKMLLLGLSMALYAANMRLIGRPEGVRTRAKMMRNVAIIAAAALLYLYTGAACKVAYGLRHDREIPNRARIWYRDRLRVYGALPIARLLGSDFAGYVGPPSRAAEKAEGALTTGTTPAEIARFRRVVADSPRGLWADHALYALARALQAQPEGVPEARALHEQLARQYPRSAFAAPSLWCAANLARVNNDAAAEESALQRLVQQYPSTREAAKGADLHARTLWEHGRRDETVALLRGLAPKALAEARPTLWQRAGDCLAEMGQPQQARESYNRALAEIAPILDRLEKTIAEHEDNAPDIVKQRGDLQNQRGQIWQSLKGLPK